MTKKYACFIHSTYLEEWGDEVLRYLLEYLCKHPIVNCLEFIYVNNTGFPLFIENLVTIHPKIKVVNYSDDPSSFEIPTIRIMHCFSTLNPNYKLLYIHTKGVSRSKENSNPIRSWVNYMLHGLVHHYKDCIQLLDVYNSVGCNELSEFSHDNPPHYSGNFWWTNSSYMSTLPVDKLTKKWDPEFYIIGNKKYCTNSFNIYSLYNVYDVDYKTENYQDLMKKRFEEDILYCRLDCFEKTGYLPLYFAIMMGKAYPGHCIIIVDDVITDSKGEVLYPVEDVISIHEINEVLKRFNITIIPRKKVKMTIYRVLWGLKPVKEVDLTRKLVKTFSKPNYFSIPIGYNVNTLLERDPIPNTRKQLYLTYSINGYSFERCFDEIMILYSKDHLMLDFVNYTNVYWIESANIDQNLGAWEEESAILADVLPVKKN